MKTSCSKILLIRSENSWINMYAKNYTSTGLSRINYYYCTVQQKYFISLFSLL